MTEGLNPNELETVTGTACNEVARKVFYKVMGLIDIELERAKTVAVSPEKLMALAEVARAATDDFDEDKTDDDDISR